MADETSTRRGFLEQAGKLGSIPLIGTALAAGPFQVNAVPQLKGKAKSVTIPTHEFAGPNGAPWMEERLDFPATWDVHVMEMAGHNLPVLTPQQIAEQCSRPIGAKSLGELAEGKKKVAISFDDLTRTTPAYAVTPWLVAELAKAGIDGQNILFIGSFGTHRAMTQEEVARKLGPQIAKNYAWLNHDAFDNVKEVGTTTRGNKILLNQTFLGADLKICISGIKVHQDAGYGGGAKAILPGLAGLPTVEYNHTQILTKVRTTGPVKIFKNDMRLDMIEAARMVKVDYTIQILYNDRLRPTHIWAGDIVDAHHAGVRVAAKTYCTPTLKDADIVVANAYPQNAQAFHGALWINYSVRDGGKGSSDHPASAGFRSDSLSQQPPGGTGWRDAIRHDRAARERHLRQGRRPRQRQADQPDRVLAVSHPQHEEQLSEGYVFLRPMGRRGRQAQAIASGRSQGSGIPVRGHAAPGDRTGRISSLRRLPA
jgi:hypothetical protein